MIAGNHRHSTPGRESVVVVRLLVSILIAGQIGRTFLAEPSHIPTGSMAPHRLGHHQKWACPNCRFPFEVGLLADQTLPVSVCPNCALTMKARGSDILGFEGDRVWVDKATIGLKRPERWQEAIFYSPDAPLTPHLKRVAGLPGESVRIDGGDLYINGRRTIKGELARKALSVKVYDQSYPAMDASRFPRWRFRTSSGGASRWGIDDLTGKLQRRPPLKESTGADLEFWDWADYRHISPSSGEYGPVTDFLAYQGRDPGGEQEVGDLWFRADIGLGQSERLALRLSNREVEIMVEVGLKLVNREPASPPGDVWINGQRVSAEWKPLTSIDQGRGEVNVELSWVDHQLEFRFNGGLVFAPLSFETIEGRRPDSNLRDSPAGLGVKGGGSRIRNFQIFRDNFITNRLASEPVIGFGVRQPVELPADGYFVLGDNSGFSVDSRFWKNGPVVPWRALIGRPIGQGR